MQYVIIILLFAVEIDPVDVFISSKSPYNKLVT